MAAAIHNDRALRRRLRSLDLGIEERIFLRVLSTLGLTAWALIVYAQLFGPPEALAPTEKPIEVAKVLIKPPPPPEEKKEEPKPVPLPPRAETEKPKPAPVKKAPPKAAVVAKAQPKPEPPRRSVATMGLLSMLSSETPRSESQSQRVGQALRTVDFRQAKDLTEDVGSLTGSVGARDKVGVGEMVAGLPHGTGTNVVLQGQVISPISGPGGGATAESASGGGKSGRSISEIRDVVAQYIAGLKYLYDRELKQRPSLHGKVTVEFVVTGPGDVSEVRLVSSALGHPALENAILGRIRGWRFPSKPGDATRVMFPFDFIAPAG
jgi:periplasmic protein TonB